MVEKILLNISIDLEILILMHVASQLVQLTVLNILICEGRELSEQINVVYD